MRSQLTAVVLGVLLLTGSVGGWTAVVLTVLLLEDCARAQSAPPASAPAGKTAGEVMKNVQVLKDMPASSWTETMAFVSASLDVSCEHCHNTQAFDSDAKKAKLTARSMMKMVREINAANFDGRPVVTCNTCHQGSLQPKGMPSLWQKTPEEIAAFQKQVQADRAAAPAAAPPPGPAASLPTAAQVFADYRRAVAGGPVQSAHLSADMSSDRQPAAQPLVLDTVFPDKALLHIKLPTAEVSTTLNGNRGWIVTPQGKRDLGGPGIESLRPFIRLAEPVKYAELEAGGRVIGTERIGGRSCTVVESDTPARLWRLYFDAQTGLLYKAYAEIRVPGFGVIPAETIYEDYRSVGGVNIPFSVVARNPGDAVRMKISEIQINVAEDPAKFEPPAPAPGK